jgi:hypothetical protein
MKRFGVYGIICFLVAGFFVLASPVAFAQDKMPWDGTVELSTGSVAAGVGFSWGGGTLTFMGKKYPFKVDGLSVGSVGITNATAVGKVYNLKDVADFAGNFSALSVGMTVGGGGTGLTMKNQKGVILDIVSTEQGVNFTLAASGLKIELK